ncbi:unnamed protein product [Camellia sinensis]
MGGRGRVLRALLGAVFFMGFIWFLFVGVLASRVTRTTTTTIHESTAKSDELLKLIAKERQVGHWDLDPNYESKRRVPNGPDPIHNRESGENQRTTRSSLSTKKIERSFRTLFRRLIAMQFEET